MAKDYAKKTARKPIRQNNNRQKPKKLGWLWLSVGLLIGLMFSGVLHIKSNSKVVWQQLTQHTAQKKASHKHKKSSLPHMPHFDFYTLLPDSEKKQKQVKQQQTRKQMESTTHPTLENSTYYLLQVGSFRHYSDADKLKAQLTLQGFAVQTQKFMRGNAMWHRVLVGPYQNGETARGAQKKLTEMHLTSMVIRRRT